MKDNVILSVENLNIKFTLRGQVRMMMIWLRIKRAMPSHPVRHRAKMMVDTPGFMM